MDAVTALETALRSERFDEMACARLLAGTTERHFRYWGNENAGDWVDGFPTTTDYPFAVAVQRNDGNYLALPADFDAKDGTGTVDAERHARACADLMWHHGVPCILVRSSPLGWHVLARIEEPGAPPELIIELGRRLAAGFYTFDRKPMSQRAGGRAAVRPPGALGRRRPDGTVADVGEMLTVRSTPEDSWDEAVLTLRVAATAEDVQRLCDALPTAPVLPPQARATPPCATVAQDLPDDLLANLLSSYGYRVLTTGVRPSPPARGRHGQRDRLVGDALVHECGFLCSRRTP